VFVGRIFIMLYNLAYENQQRVAENRLRSLITKKAIVGIKEHKEKRTNAQNRYFHFCIKIISEETGYTIKEMKTVMKREFGYYYEKNGMKFLRSTAEMDTAELSKFTDEVRNWAAMEGYYILSPEEYGIEREEE